MKNILKTTAISSMGLFCCFALDAMELDSNDIPEKAANPAGIKVVTIQAVGGEELSQDDLVYLMNSMANYVLPSGKRISINAEPFAPIDIVQPQNQLSISLSSSFDKNGFDDIQVGHSDDIQVGDNDLKKEKIVEACDSYTKTSFQSGRRVKNT